MKENNWIQAERENKKEINQLSKTLLKKAGGSPDPGSLYCLQLALWEVANAPLDIESKPGLREWLEALWCQWSPSGAMEMLEDDEDQIMCQVSKINMDDPIAVAAQILDQIDSRLSARVHGYPLPTSQKNYR